MFPGDKGSNMTSLRPWGEGILPKYTPKRSQKLFFIDTSGKAKLWPAPSRCNQIQLLSQKDLAHTEVVNHWKIVILSFPRSDGRSVKVRKTSEAELGLHLFYPRHLLNTRKIVLQDRTMQNWQQEPVCAQSRLLDKTILIINNNLGEYLC